MVNTIYRTDFYQWTVAQADHLRNEEYAELDVPNLIDEIEAMAAKERRELTIRLARIMEHLLKLTCEPRSKAVRGWQQSIEDQRLELEVLLAENATLRMRVDDFIPNAYKIALRLANGKMKCKVEDFPSACAWTAAQMLDLDWLPG
ncbi:MAG: DUF29 domain-containing protein [Chloroflexota bacterium]|nr:DUF29 domain-containing protein [Chloroflexota bacterium]